MAANAHIAVLDAPPLPSTPDIQWVARLVAALQAQRTPTSQAETALASVCDALGAEHGMIVFENAGALINDLLPSRWQALAACGRYAGSAGVPEAVSTAVQLLLTGDAEVAAATGLELALVDVGTSRGAIVLETDHRDAPAVSGCAAGLLALTLTNQVLTTSSTLNPMSGVSTFSRALQELRLTLMLGARINAPTSLIAFEIDNFSAISETWGRTAGDLVIRAVTRATRAACRRTDDLAHYESGSFLFAMPATPLPGALKVADNLRDYLSAVRVDFEGRELSVTISAGVATSEAGSSDVRNLLRRAADAMKHSRLTGGNRVSTARPS